MTLDYQAFSNGPIQFQREVSAVVDGVTIAQTLHFVMNPGDDVADQPDDVRAACALWWTPEHVAAWEATKAAAPLALEPADIETANG